MDQKLLSGKVFLRQFHGAAIVIQRNVRGFQCRKKVSLYKETLQYNSFAAHIQKTIRCYLHRRLLLQTATVVKVQAAFRGWSYRVQSRAFLLTRKLEWIEARRKQDLAAIEQNKNKEVSIMKQELAKQRSAAAVRERKLGALVEQSGSVTTFLRRENKRLREANEALYSKMKLLHKENKLLETQNLTVGVQGSALGKNIKHIHSSVQQLEYICQRCEIQKKQFEAAIFIRDEYIMAENRLGRIFLTCNQRMVLELEDRCQESDLVFQVEELCLAAYDHSESIDNGDDNYETKLEESSCIHDDARACVAAVDHSESVENDEEDDGNNNETKVEGTWCIREMIGHVVPPPPAIRNL
jgi:IQ calmodulin-binding motif